MEISSEDKYNVFVLSINLAKEQAIELANKILENYVQEMNRYNEDPVQVMEYLNTKPSDSDGEYQLELTLVGREPIEVYHDYTYSHPLTAQGIHVQYRLKADMDEWRKEGKDEEKEPDTIDLVFSNKELEYVDSKNGHYTFVNEHGSPKG